MTTFARARLRLAWNLLAGLGLACVVACGSEGPGGDAAPHSMSHNAGSPRGGEVVRTSKYVAVTDGTRIAVDVYLPGDLAPGERIPVLFEQTRHWRSHEFRAPFDSWVDALDERIEYLVRRGYAYVVADVRGTGASFGTRPHPWGRVEIEDGGYLADWAARQLWSNGRVGALGTAYSGTAAEMLLLSRSTVVKAIAPRFALFDAYADFAFPGGMPQRGFLRAWMRANESLDRNLVPEIAGYLPVLMVRGVRATDDAPMLLDKAVREHVDNASMSELVEQGVHRDDLLLAGGTGLDGISPRGRAARIESKGVPVYSWSGWFDGALSMSAIKRFRAVRTQGSRLVLGPWSHGGRFSGSPTSPGVSAFDSELELLRFFDAHLREIDTGIAGDAPVYYYTMVEDRWKSAEDWPPPSEPTTFFFGPDARLTSEPPSEEEASDRYQVDPAATSGSTSRWDSMLTEAPVEYGDRASEDRKLLTYTSEPLDRDMEVTGHPLLYLNLALSTEDGAFFAYLEDVAPDGSVRYVTEGILRARFRRLRGDRGPLTGVAPVRQYMRRDARRVKQNTDALYELGLLPTSYRFLEGHSIRLALAGADSAHFDLVPSDTPPVWEVFRSKGSPSRLVLPVVESSP